MARRVQLSEVETRSMQFRITPALISAFVLIAGTVLAHTYDPNKPVTLNGTVGK
jgi:hypothetical protein